MGMDPRLLRPRSTTPTFMEKGYTRLWGLSTKSTATVSGSAEADTGLYAVQWQGKPVEVYQSGETFSETPIVDSSANALAVTNNGAAISTAQSKFGGSSGYFDGVNDYASVPYSSNFSPSSGSAMTIECWLRPSETQTAGPSGDGNSGAIVSLRNSATFAGYEFSIRDDLRLTLLAYAGGTWHANGLVSAASLVSNVWSHVALVITSAGATTLYINGVADSGISDETILYDENESDANLYVGVGGDGYYSGYIDGLRIVKGTALYTGSSFPVPTTAPTAVTGTSLLLNFDAATKGKRAFEVYPVEPSSGGVMLHFEDGLADSSDIGHQFTAHGNAAVSSTESAVGSQSVYFDGNESYITAPIHPSMSLGSGDFTIEAWVYQQSGGEDRFRIAGVGVGPNGSSPPDTTGWSLWMREGGQVWLYRYDGPSEAVNIASDVLVAQDEWVHVAACRIDGTTTVYVNGVVSGSWADSTAYNHVPSPDPASNLFYSGAVKEGGSWRYNTGYVDELRVVVGQGLYPSTFTPPTTPLASPTPFSVAPSGQFDAFMLSNNSLVSLRAEDVALEAGSGGYWQTTYPYSYVSNPAEAGSIANNALSSQALDAFYTDLMAGGGDLFVQGNPGIDADDPTIATAKGYTVFGSVPPSTALLLNFNGGTFVDSSPNELSVTPYNAVISTAQSKFGGASGYFNGSAYLTAPFSSAFEFGTGDFTVEGWIYWNEAEQGPLISAGAGFNGPGPWHAWALSARADDNHVYWSRIDDRGDSHAFIISAPYTFSLNQWYHIAVSRTGTATKIFIDGIEIASSPDTNNYTAIGGGNNNDIHIGYWFTGLGDQYHNGYIDDLRIVKGAALYTGPFAVPASQLGVYP